jgi:hypothetical protein
MQITGTITKVLPTVTGTSANGKEWKKKTVIVTTEGQYPDEIAVDVLKDDLECSLGASGTIHINLKSREYNGKYYTNVTAWKSEMVAVKAEEKMEQNQDDLPF